MSTPKNIANAALQPLTSTIFLIVLALALVYLILRKLKQTDTTNLDNLEDEIKPNLLTYPESQYIIFADNIEAATAPMFDDEQAIYNVFQKLKNNDDVLKLITSFGRRSFWAGNGYFYNATLNEVLTNQLSTDEIKHLNEILTGNGITIKF